MIAPGAEEIFKARMKGFKPADTVIVSLVGKLGFENPQCHPAPGQDYDWRWCKALDVVVFMDSNSDWAALLPKIKICEPSGLYIWAHDMKRGAEVMVKPVQAISGSRSTMLLDDGSILKDGWRWVIDFCNWHEEDEKAFTQ